MDTRLEEEFINDYEPKKISPYKPEQRRSNHPRLKDVEQMMKISPDLLFFDESGRIYGPMDKKNELFLRLIEDTEYDKEDMLIMWVYLIANKKGLYTKMRAKINYADDVNTFPSDSELITLRHYATSNYYTEANVIAYPERIHKKDRGAIVILHKIHTHT
jgi:hypothetical protein